MKSTKVKKRDNNIDFFRGIAAIWIVFIHVCFHSGDAYVAGWLRSLSLIVDVPLFIFISGMTYNFNKSFFKSLKGIVNIWFKWLIFLLLFFGIGIIFYDTGSITLDNVISSIFFNVGNNNIFPSVQWSMWFINMFFIVTVISNTIIYIYNKNFKNLDNFKYVLVILVIFLGMNMYWETFLHISSLNLMYIFLYCLGYYLYNLKFKSIKEFLGIIIVNIALLLFFLKFSGLGFLDMQKAKILPHINYIIYSLISILTVTYLKDKIKIKDKNIFCFIGKNALLFYFCQGIGASLVYFVYPYVAEFKGTILIMFLSNLIISSLCFIILYFILKLLKSLKFPKIEIFMKK